MPLILAWIKLCTDPLQHCERKNCGRLASFAIDEYEDRRVVEEALKRNIIDLAALEDTLWKHAQAEQMKGIFTVHQTFYNCLHCLQQLIMRFLNTNKGEDIRALLSFVQAGKCTAVQWHYLSWPEQGL